MNVSLQPGSAPAQLLNRLHRGMAMRVPQRKAGQRGPRGFRATRIECNSGLRHSAHHVAFSLVEVMCAVAILAVALVGLTQAINVALTSSKESELQTTAAWIAAGLIETLRADGILTDGESEGEGSGSYSIYRYKQTIKGTEIDGLHEVVVEVAEQKTGKAIYELRTMLFDPPTGTNSTSSVAGRGSSRSGGRGGQR